jgi:hypothetical protein
MPVLDQIADDHQRIGAGTDGREIGQRGAHFVHGGRECVADMGVADNLKTGCPPSSRAIGPGRHLRAECQRGPGTGGEESAPVEPVQAIARITHCRVERHASSPKSGFMSP